jgi:hypothetical protein
LGDPDHLRKDRRHDLVSGRLAADLPAGDQGSLRPERRTDQSEFFLSLTQTFRNAPVYWRKHWTIGELELGEINEKEKVLVLHLKNHALHPILCKFEEGYFLGISSYVVKAKRIEETQCTFRGAPYHEYKIYWE